MENISQRLDRFIKRKYGKNIPQSMIEKALRNGLVLVNGEKTKAKNIVSEYDDVFVRDDIVNLFSNFSSKDITFTAEYLLKFVESFKKMILYEDSDFIIVNKPCGLAVQMGSKVKKSLDSMAVAYDKNAKLVHRIDSETSGITIFAKNIKTAQYMLNLFKARKVEKKYLALVSGNPSQRKGIINAPLLKTKLGVVVDVANGKDAETRYEVVKNFPKNINLVSAVPKTGRTHQIRVHMSRCLKTPILGDKKYGGREFWKLCLHAQRVSFVAQTGKRITVEAPLPKHIDMQVHEK